MMHLAEAAGARLSLRFRHGFARHAADSTLLTDAAHRGHEIGAHAHGRRLKDAVSALASSGLTPTVAAPGLVQVGPGGRALLLQQAASLGITLVTDHSAQRAWAYEGLRTRPEQGILVAAPTVRPFDWGLMSTDGTRHGLTDAAVDQLSARAAQATAQGARWFGVTLHEHDLCAPGTLEPRPAALDAFCRLLHARVVPSRLAVSVGAPPLRPVPAHMPSDRRIRMARAVFSVTRRARAVLPRRPASPRIALRTPRPDRLAVGRRHIAITRHGPPQTDISLVVSHSGHEGGRQQRLRPLGVSLDDLTRRGWAVWFYDRAGTGDSPPAPLRSGWRAAEPLAPGNPAHTADWRAVLAAAQAEGAPVVALSWSAGIVPVLAAAARGHRPDALVDAEAPADRWSLVPPRPSALAGLDPWDDAAWAGWEPVALLPKLGCAYARLQAEQDHVHDRMHEHAHRMTAAAAAAGLEVRAPALLAGRLHAHPEHAVRVLEWAAEQAVSARR